MRYRGIFLTPLVAALFAAALAGCGGDGGKGAKPRVTSTTTLTPSPSPSSPSASPFAPNVGDLALRVGETRKGRASTTRLMAIRYPLPTEEWRTPDHPGDQFLGLQVRQCVSDDYRAEDYDGEQFYSTYNGDWFIVAPSGNQVPGNGSSWDDWPRPKFPEDITMNAGECAKGWLAVEVPKGMKVKKVVWRPGGETVAEWLP